MHHEGQLIGPPVANLACTYSLTQPHLTSAVIACSFDPQSAHSPHGSKAITRLQAHLYGRSISSTMEWTQYKHSYFVYRLSLSGQMSAKSHWP